MQPLLLRKSDNYDILLAFVALDMQHALCMFIFICGLSVHNIFFNIIS